MPLMEGLSCEQKGALAHSWHSHMSHSNLPSQLYQDLGMIDEEVCLDSHGSDGLLSLRGDISDAL